MMHMSPSAQSMEFEPDTQPPGATQRGFPSLQFVKQTLLPLQYEAVPSVPQAVPAGASWR